MHGWLLILALLPGSVHAAELELVAVTREGDTYFIDLSVKSTAPVAVIRELLTDFERLDRLHPFIRSSRILPNGKSDVIRVRTDSEVCLLIFCKDLLRIEDVTEKADGGLSSVIVPGTGSLRAGHSDWSFESVGEGSRIRYVGSLVPDFFVPPLIGPMLIKRGMSKELIVMIENMERLAREHVKAR